MKRGTILASLALGSLLAVAMPAGAVQYTLTAPGAGLSGVTGPYGTVDVTLVDPTHATVTFTALNHFLFGGEGAFGLNVNGTVEVLGYKGSMEPQTPNKAPGFTPASGKEGEFGSFNVWMKGRGGYQKGVQTVTFSLFDTSGTWSSDLNVLTANPNGYFAAGHILVRNPDGSNNGLAGYAADGEPGASVPDGGSTIVLLGMALLAIGPIGRRIAKV